MCKITLDNIHFSYNGGALLSDVSLQIDSGEFVVVLGPNGSGKSTLLKLMAGLLQPQQGRITMDESSIQEFQKTGRIGYVPQNYGRNSSFPATVAEIVALGLVAQPGKLTGTAARHIVAHMLSLVGMENYRNRRLADLSGGQQQRVMVARALAGNPGVLLLDEPTSGIDPDASTQIYQLLSQLNETLGVTVVMVSHDVDKATQWATRVACINYGLCYYGDGEDFRKNHIQSRHAWYYGA